MATTINDHDGKNPACQTHRRYFLAMKDRFKVIRNMIEAEYWYDTERKYGVEFFSLLRALDKLLFSP